MAAKLESNFMRVSFCESSLQNLCREIIRYQDNNDLSFDAIHIHQDEPFWIAYGYFEVTHDEPAES